MPFRAVSSMSWDPSVQSLVAFPQALADDGAEARMGQQYRAGLPCPAERRDGLRSASSQCGVQGRQPVELIAAEGRRAARCREHHHQHDRHRAGNPQVVYVPSYNPTVVYGTWPYPTYPPVYMPPPPGYVVGTALVSGLAFGAGIAITNSLWGGCDWGHNDVNVNVNRYNNINVNNRIDANRTTANWDRSTAAANRNRNVANNSRLQGAAANRNAGGGAGALGGANADRSAFRGRDNAQRDQARNTLSQRTGQNLNSPATDRVQNIRQGGNTKDGLSRNGRGGAQGAANRDCRQPRPEH